MTTLHDIARFYRARGLVGEDRAAVTTSVALLGDASVVVRGASGTGKTEIQRGAVALFPEDKVATVDMVSEKAIWSKGMVARIVGLGDDGLVVFPEDQNASDNDEMVKVKKKWGDNSPASREKSEDYGNGTSLTTLPVRKFISTAALSNEAHQRTFDAESARRVIKVPTNPGSKATRDVLDSMADALVRGEDAGRVLSALDRRRVTKAYHAALARRDITKVRFLGAKALTAAIPDTFPEARSALALFRKVLLGVGRFYADREVIVDGEVFLSPGTVAEAWAFYGDFLLENALKLDTGDRSILAAIPQPAWQGSAPTPESCVGLNDVMKALRPVGITDPGFTKARVAALIPKGFLVEAEGSRTTKWHRTGIADFVNNVDWKAVIDACENAAPEHLGDGDECAQFLVACQRARGNEAMQNPLTGAVGPILGDKSVLYFNAATGAYTSVGSAPEKPRGILAYGGASA